MKFGVHTGLQETSFGELISLWRRVEELGFEWISVWDHIYPTVGSPSQPNLDAIVALSALATCTSRVRVGCLVFNSTLRPPALLAKAGAAIDQLSAGRFEMGLGAGWNRDEQVQSGIDFPADGERVSILEESVQAIRLLWEGESADFDGEHVQLTGARCIPKPVQEHVPIWIGAFRPRALGVAGRYADRFNVAYVPAELWASMWKRVCEAAEAGGRGGAITPTVNVGLFVDSDEKRARVRCEEATGAPVTGGQLLGTPDQIAESVAEYESAGVAQLNLVARAPFDLDGLEAFASEVIPQFSSEGT